MKMTAKEWIEKEKEKAEKQFNDSYSTRTRDRLNEKIWNCEEILSALDCAEELAYYRMLDNQMKSRFGISIGRYLEK